MRDEDFAETVGQRAGIDNDRARTVSRAVVQALTEQVDADMARSLLDQLPRGLRSATTVSDAPKPLPLNEFRDRVSDIAGTDAFDVDRHVHAVVTTLRDAVTGGQVDEIVARLPDVYRDFLPAEAAPVRADAFWGRVREDAELPSRRDAEIATRVTLVTLADRLSKGQAYDLATALPAELRPLLKSGSPASEAFDLEGFLDRLAGQQQVDRETARRQARAVLRTVREHVPADEVGDTFAQLPRPLAELFQ